MYSCIHFIKETRTYNIQVEKIIILLKQGFYNHDFFPINALFGKDKHFAVSFPQKTTKSEFEHA